MKHPIDLKRAIVRGPHLVAANDLPGVVQTNPHGRQVDTHLHEPPPLPFGIQGPLDEEFLTQEGALHGFGNAVIYLVRIALWLLALIGAGAVGRYFQLF